MMKLLRAALLVLFCAAAALGQAPPRLADSLARARQERPLPLARKQKPPFGKPSGFWRPWGPGFALSLAVCLGGSVADVAVSRSKINAGLGREANPLFARSDGKLRTPLALGLTLGFCAPTIFFQQPNNAKGADLAGFLGGGIHTALAVHNAGVGKGN